MGDGGGGVRPRSGGGRGRRPRGAWPSGGRGRPGPRSRTGRRVIHLRRAAECPSSVHGVRRWPRSASGTANCDRDSRGGDGGGGGSTGSAAGAPGWTHSPHSRWDSRTVVEARTASLWHPFPLISTAQSLISYTNIGRLAQVLLFGTGTRALSLPLHFHQLIDSDNTDNCMAQSHTTPTQTGVCTFHLALAHSPPKHRVSPLMYKERDDGSKTGAEEEKL